MGSHERDYEKCTTRHMQGNKFGFQSFTLFLQQALINGVDCQSLQNSPAPNSMNMHY